MGFNNDRAYLGNTMQVFGAKEYVMTGGAADGLRAIDLYNNAGLRMTLLPGRAMDIGELSMGGKNVSFISASGYTATGATERYNNWTRSFAGGFLYTCGLDNTGVPNEDIGDRLCQHGSLSYIPAENVSITTDSTNAENPVITVSGIVNHSAIFGAKLKFRRAVSLGYNDSFFTISDTVINDGFMPAEYMALYHINFGYPFFDDRSEMIVNELGCVPRDEVAKPGFADRLKYEEPVPGYQEQVFYYDVKAEQGRCAAALTSPNCGLCCTVEYPKDPLGTLVQWKNTAAGDYVTALEPSTGEVYGRSQTRKEGKLRSLQPGESKQIDIKVSFSKLK